MKIQETPHAINSYETNPDKLIDFHGTLIDPEADVEYETYIPGQDTPITIIGDWESIAPQAEANYQREQKQAANKPAVTQNKAPQTVSKPELAYEDFSMLPSRQIARMKVSAWIYDRQHKTNMLNLLNERISDDRDVRFARELGLLGVTHCAKHEKAVATLRRIV